MPLQVSTSIPYGNAADVRVQEKPGEYEVSFTPHPHGGPECLWFCFRVSQVGTRDPARPRMRLVLRCQENMLGGGQPSAMRPVVRRQGGVWERLGPGSAEPLPDGRNNAVWTIDTPVPVMDVAYCYPYGPDEIAALIRDTQGYWKTDTIGISPQGRPIVRLANRYGSPGAEEPGLYLMARQHSGETPGSWVLDGLLRHMTTLGDAAPLIWVVPLANIDGVMQGDYGKDNFPYDLNRAWGQVPMRHETLLIQRDMQRWAKRCRPALAADFHAPGACETDGIYCFLVSPQHAPREHEATLPWTTAIRASVDARYCAPNFERVAQYASRWETPNFTRASAQAFSIPAFSMEVPYGRCGDLVLTVEEYREAGARIARGMAGVLAAG